MFLNDQTCLRFNKFDTQVNEVVISMLYRREGSALSSLESAGAGVLPGRPIVDPSLLPLYRDGGLMTSVPTSPFVTGFVMAAV